MKVSVIIPCYNGEAFIGQAIGSLLEQTRPPEEILVVDDGSTDRSAEIARKFGEPVIVLEAGGGGAQKARNHGAEYSSGDALMFFDADDVLGPEGLHSLVKELEKNPGGIVACPWYRLDNVDDKWVKRPPSCKSLGKDQDYLSGWITGWYHPPCSVLWSRAAYKETGGWDTRVTVNQDGDLMMRALINGIQLRITEKGAAFYRRYPREQNVQSQSGKQFTESGRSSQIFVLKKIIALLDEHAALDRYRKPLIKALNTIKEKCQNVYPDRAEECDRLITDLEAAESIENRQKIFEHRLFSYLSYRQMRRLIFKMKGYLAKQHFFGLKQFKHKGKKPEEINYGIKTYRNKVNMGSMK